MATASSGRPSGRIGRRRSVRLVEQDRGLRGAAHLRAVGGQRQGLAEDAVPGRDVREPEGTGDVRARHGPRHEPVAARLPDGDEVVAVRVADGPDGGLERLVGVARAADGPDDGRGDGQVEMVALGLEGIGAIGVGGRAR